MNPRLGCVGIMYWVALAAAIPLMSAPNVMVPAGSVWKYLPITNDVGTAWREFNFDDSTWASGPAQLGYGDQDEMTVVPFVFDLELIADTEPPSQPPLITLTAPFIGAAFNVGADVPLAVTTSDPDGSVASVEYFTDNNRLGEVRHPPFSLIWSNAPAGAHALTARANDNSGAWTRSVPRSIRVGGFMLVSTGAVWNYLDDQTDPGTAWRELVFDDSGWSNGCPSRRQPTSRRPCSGPSPTPTS